MKIVTVTCPHCEKEYKVQVPLASDVPPDPHQLRMQALNWALQTRRLFDAADDIREAAEKYYLFLNGGRH